MSEAKAKLEFRVSARRVDAHGSLARCKDAEIVLDTDVRIHGIRQDVPPRMESIDYEILVDTDEDDRRIALLHDNVRRLISTDLRTRWT